MKKIKIITCAIAIISLAIGGCKTLDTNLTIPERRLPTTFFGKVDSTTIADINWRQYFGDSLLVNLIDSALIKNLDLTMALHRIEVVRSGKERTLGELLPQLSLNLSGGVRKFGEYTMDGAGNLSAEIAPGQKIPVHLPDMGISIQMSWEIDIWGKLRNQHAAAVAEYLASLEGANLVISNLVFDIANSYYRLVALDNELDVVRQFIQKQEKSLEVIQLKKEAGYANELGVQQFKSQLLNAKAVEFEMLQKITEMENLINFLLGRYPQLILRNKESIFRELPHMASGVPSFLLSRRPDIREAEWQVTASKFNLESAKAAFLPNLNISAGFGFQAFNPEFLFLAPASIAYSALGGLIAPIVNMTALNARFNTAKANQLTAMYRYQKAILNGYVEVANQLSRIKNLQRIHALKQEETDVLGKLVETATELFLTSKASYLEVLIAQQNFLRTKLEWIGISTRQQIEAVTLYKTLGGGWR